ncbi:LPXTG cell wall anchor domain-containing protein [Streptomyces poriticola]|uniref:LPXTG cell wall anchor domain-containing protein n=1 Tax=Streptomyces poriticola TaxID=3120506 RepID=UPI002FCE674F
MKLRRAMAVAAATAVLAPLALLSAPAAFATGDDTSPSPSVTATEGAESGDSSAEDTDGAAASTSAAASESTEEQDPSAEEAESDKDTEDGDTTGDNTGDTDGDKKDDEDETGDASPSVTSSPTESAGTDEPEWDPYQDCESYDWDEKLTATIEGLPNKIVAGSGWHNFQYVVENASDKDLKDVWVEAYTEYEEATEASLAVELAEIQVKEDGRWTSGFQQSLEFEDGESLDFPGSFVALVESLEKDTAVTFDLRVRVDASAPAGAAFAMTDAVYASDAAGAQCYGNGDYYDITVLAAGSEKPGDVDDAKPNGKKPEEPGSSGVKPQGEVKQITGSLAETGSSSALPVIGLVGGFAVVAGAGALFAVKRRKAGAHA